MAHVSIRQRHLLKAWANRKRLIKVREVNELASLGLIEYTMMRTNDGCMSDHALTPAGRAVIGQNVATKCWEIANAKGESHV